MQCLGRTSSKTKGRLDSHFMPRQRPPWRRPVPRWRPRQTKLEACSRGPGERQKLPQKRALRSTMTHQRDLRCDQNIIPPEPHGESPGFRCAKIPWCCLCAPAEGPAGLELQWGPNTHWHVRLLPGFAKEGSSNPREQGIHRR